jgi:hypothetical protein
MARAEQPESQSGTQSNRAAALHQPVQSQDKSDEDINIMPGNDSESDSLLTHTQPTSKTTKTADIPVILKVTEEKKKVCTLW